jgi:hypothetical protein
MTAMHDEPRRTDLGSSVEVLLQKLPARDADPIIGGRHIEHVRRMHVEPYARVLCRCLQRCCTAGVPDLWALPRLWIPKEELRKCRFARRGFCDWINLVSMAAYLQSHGFES